MKYRRFRDRHKITHGAEAKAALSRVFQKHGFGSIPRLSVAHILTQVSVPAALNMDYSYNFPGDRSHYAYPGEVTSSRNCRYSICGIDKGYPSMSSSLLILISAKLKH